MTLEQVERQDVDPLRLLLERCQHIGREAGGACRSRATPWPLGVEELDAIGRKRRLNRPTVRSCRLPNEVVRLSCR
jgi:hypothetical protein